MQARSVPGSDRSCATSARRALLGTTLIEQAHAAGLRVHTYTFRNEPATLAPQYGNDPLKEYRQFYDMGVDGVFSDFSDTALAARKTIEQE